MAARDGFDPAEAYRVMMRIRLTEEALVQAWHDGLVPGEYHSTIGEEGIIAGVVMHLSGEDAIAADHRSTGPFIARGTDPLGLMLEVLGSEDGMDRGWAGHMHLMDSELNVTADGIVGASAPLAIGNALANASLHPGRIAVSFHGEGAMNQGMLMEAYNLAAAWNLPVLFVCKDNDWSITTHTADVTGGKLADRAASFGLAVEEVDGWRVDEVYRAAGKLVDRARAGKGPGFLHAKCHRPGGHFEGDPLVRMLQHPREQARAWGPGVVEGVRAVTGATRKERSRAVAELTRRGALALRDWNLSPRRDPVRVGRRLLLKQTALKIENAQRREIDAAIAEARARVGNRPRFRVIQGGA